MAYELGTAYVQIMPSAKGIKGNIEKALGNGGDAGQTYGNGLVSMLKKVIIGAGVGKALSATISEGAKLQQSLGGVETMFKENAEKVIRNSESAYRRAGVSQNEYLESLTSFSASLIQSLGGDTAKATEIADKAMVDMSDNANKYGTNIADIQRAYQGFAKQNFVMLDNLKLGYGGTKSEMERLLKDAEAISGVHYDIENYADIIEAIHTIQEEYGVAGTTAKEATTTISGSFGMMKSAFKDLLGQLVIGKSIDVAMEGLVTSAVYFAKNIVSAFANIITNIPVAVRQMINTILLLFDENASDIKQGALMMFNQFVTGIKETIPQVLNQVSLFISDITTAMTSKAPQFMQGAKKLFDSITTAVFESLPNIISSFGNLLNSLVDFLIKSIPLIFQASVTFFKSLIDAIKENLPKIVEALGTVIRNIVSTIVQNAPMLFQSALNFFMEFLKAVISAVPSILGGIYSLLGSFISTVIQYGPQLLASAITFIGNLIAGIISQIPNVIQAMADGAASAIEGFTSGADWGAGGGGATSAIAQGVVTVVQAIIDAGAAIAKALWDTIAQTDWASLGWNVTKAIGGGLIKNSLAGQLFSAGKDALGGWLGLDWGGAGETSAQTMDTGMLNLTPQFYATGGTLGTNSINGLSSKNTNARNSGTGLANNIISGFQTKYPVAQTSGITLANRGLTGISSRYTPAQNTGSTFGGRIITGFNSKATPIYNTGATLGNKGISGFATKYGNGSTAGNTLGNRVNSGFGGLFSAIVGTGNHLGNGATNGVRDGGSGMTDVGYYLARGVQNGIRGGRSGVINEAVNMAVQAYREAKRALDINSPSRLFRDGVGKWIPLGLAEGIRRYSDVSDKASEEMARSVYESAQIGDLDSLVNTDFSTSSSSYQNSPLSQVITLLNQLVDKDQNIYMDGEKVGDTISPIINRKLGVLY